jgi:hypothetical protein
LEEEVEATILLKVAAAIVAEVSRNSQATAAAIQSPEGRRGPER